MSMVNPAPPGAAGPFGGAGGDVGGDAARLNAVRRVLTSGPDIPGLDRLTRLAADLLRTPFAQVSLLAEEQYVASLHGAELAVTGQTTPVAESLCAITVEQRATVIINDTLADSRAVTLPPVTDGGVRAYLGVPLLDSAGNVLGALCVYDRQERSWTANDVGVLGEIAVSVVAELELRALTADMTRSAAQLELALSAAEIGSFDYDLVSKALSWDDRLVALFGYDRSTFREHWDSFAARVHPDDLPRVEELLDRAVSGNGEFAAEYRIVVPDLGERWVQARGRVLPDLLGRPARLLGAAFDFTELRTTRDRLARLLETMTDAFMSLDAEWRFAYLNPEAERLLGRRSEDLLGRSVWTEYPQAVGSRFQERYEHAMATGEMVLFEERFGPLNAWFEVRAWPGPDGLSVYLHDITERRRAESEREAAILERERAYAAAASANTRLALHADASTRLAASLEPSEVLQTLSALLVPQLGAWVVVALLAENTAGLAGEVVDQGALHAVEVAHADPQQAKALAKALNRVPLSLDDDAMLEALRQVGVESALTVPLVSRGRQLGTISVAQPSGDSMDRALLVDIVGRAAVALDNALLYGAERRTGLTLQRSLLPPDLPEVPGLVLAPRYLPGATGAFVGGDWYQGVPVGSGVVLAMGDVMGHGMRSAARMGQLRAIVATLALEGHMPGELLTRLAASTDALLELELATLLVAHYDVSSRTMTVASAGHPPPLLATPGVEPEFVELVPGPPIGTLPGTYLETTVHVAPGSTLVVYTDGLVESRATQLDEGLERLRACLRDVQLPPSAVCDHVLSELDRVDGGEDDVALLVMSAQ
jgi:PAS domain S-box-containing protein